jgi:hypothetical protein
MVRAPEPFSSPGRRALTSQRSAGDASQKECMNPMMPLDASYAMVTARQAAPSRWLPARVAGLDRRPVSQPIPSPQVSA